MKILTNEQANDILDNYINGNIKDAKESANKLTQANKVMLWKICRDRCAEWLPEAVDLFHSIAYPVKQPKTVKPVKVKKIKTIDLTPSFKSATLICIESLLNGNAEEKEMAKVELLKIRM